MPTLILTPEDDRLIGEEAAGVLLGGIMGSRIEIVLQLPRVLRIAPALPLQEFAQQAARFVERSRRFR